jgi:hypothetical protein
MLVLLDDAGCPVARAARPWDRLMVRVRASRLDSDLAHGASPDATVALALRAQMLVGMQTRREVARGAQRILAAAMPMTAAALRPERSPARAHPPAGRTPPRVPAGKHPPAAGRIPVPVCRDRVRNSAQELADLIERLTGDAPVAARGVALASVLLRDGGGPLYHRASAEDMRARVREAVAALDPQS